MIKFIERYEAIGVEIRFPRAQTLDQSLSKDGIDALPFDCITLKRVLKGIGGCKDESPATLLRASRSKLLTHVN